MSRPVRYMSTTFVSLFCGVLACGPCILIYQLCVSDSCTFLFTFCFDLMQQFGVVLVFIVSKIVLLMGWLLSWVKILVLRVEQMLMSCKCLWLIWVMLHGLGFCLTERSGRSRGLFRPYVWRSYDWKSWEIFTYLVLTGR